MRNNVKLNLMSFGDDSSAEIKLTVRVYPNLKKGRSSVSYDPQSLVDAIVAFLDAEQE